jgi:DNA-binding GntR family transcriptional regulator
MTTSADRAYDFIKSAIIVGRYESGDRLTEDLVANVLGCSRTPVRDAMRRLHSEGFIEITPNSGARVACWNSDELSEITQMRMLLEGLGAELAARRIGEAELAKLAKLCDEMEGAYGPEGPDIEAISVANLAFHQTIVDGARNSRLTRGIQLLWLPSLVIRKYSLFDRASMERSFSHHREIVMALRARDPGWAGAVMRAHILAARPYDAALATTQVEGLPDKVAVAVADAG